MEYTLKNNIQKTLIVLAGFMLVLFVSVPAANAQGYYQNYTPRTQEETIAYLQGVIAQLLAQLQVQGNYQSGVYLGSGQVLGASYSNYYSSYEVEAGTGFVGYDDDEITLNGVVDLNGAPYAYVYFEYSEDDDDFDERTSKRRVTRDSNFYYTVDDLDSDEIFYYRAVSEDPSGHRDYGTTRYFYVSGSSYNDDDEPRAETDRAQDIDEDSAELNGEVDMNDFRNGVVFFVYGEDEDQIEDVERDYDSYSDVDEDGDDLQKVRVDSDLDGHDDYSERITGLDDDTEYFFQICVEYEDEDDDETLECGGVEDFETDRD